jgi:hypothetical protein
MAPVGNWSSEAELDAMKRRGWIERAREPRPREGRILVTLCHPHQTVGEGSDRLLHGCGDVPQPPAGPGREPVSAV